MGREIEKKKLISKILSMIHQSKVCPDTNPIDWARTVLELHSKGMLYCLFNSDKSKILAVWACYRIPQWKEVYAEIIPAKEEGDILYVPFFVSNDSKARAPLKALKAHLREFQNIKEIKYFRRNSDKDLRSYKFKYREGVNRVEQKSSNVHSTGA